MSIVHIKPPKKGSVADRLRFDHEERVMTEEGHDVRTDPTGGDHPVGVACSYCVGTPTSGPWPPEAYSTETSRYRLATDEELADEGDALYGPFGAGDTAAVMIDAPAGPVCVAVTHIDSGLDLLTMYREREKAEQAPGAVDAEERECAGCGDDVMFLSSRDLCDGCEEMLSQHAAWAAAVSGRIGYVTHQLVFYGGDIVELDAVTAEIQMGSEYPSGIRATMVGRDGFIRLPVITRPQGH